MNWDAIRGGTQLGCVWYINGLYLFRVWKWTACFGILSGYARGPSCLKTKFGAKQVKILATLLHDVG